MAAARPLSNDVAALLPGPAQFGALATGCAALHIWNLLEESPEPRRETGSGGQVLGHFPLGLAGSGGLTASGPVDRKLSAWIAGAYQAVLSALMALERLRHWQRHARTTTADLSGRAPGLLNKSLMRAPMLTVPQIVELAGASRAAIWQNLGIFLLRGLVREITGKGRITVWALQA